MSGGFIRAKIENVAGRYSDAEIAAQFDNPVFIVSAPRAGSTLLFQLLSKSPDVWTIGSESHGVYAQFPHLPGPRTSTKDGRLHAEHADDATASRMRLCYLALLRNADGEFLTDRPEAETSPVVFLEKTPRNSLNINFLLRVFPKARFIFLWRDAKENIASMIEAWRIGAQGRQFVTYRNLPDWPLGYWCFVLPPGWEALRGRPLAEIVAFQWRACNDIVLDDLSPLSRDRWTSLSHRELIDDPSGTLTRLCEFCGARRGEYLASREAGNLPVSASAMSAPRADKWRDHEAEILAALPGLQPTIDRIDGLA